MSISSLPISSLHMPISSMPSPPNSCLIPPCPISPCPCPFPLCPLFSTHAQLLLVLSSMQMPVSSLPSPCPSPPCQSPHCPLIPVHAHLLSASLLIALSSLPISLPFPDLCLCTSPHLIHTHLLAHANLISPVPVLNDANLDCFIQPTECGRFSQVSLCKMKWKKSHTFYFFSRKMKDHECQSSVKMESTSVNMRTAKWRLCMMLSKGEQEYQVRTWNR